MNETKCGASVFAVVLGQSAWNTSAPLKGGLQSIPYQPAQVVHEIAPAWYGPGQLPNVLRSGPERH
eukprot:8466417-Heterocapsa_arctica.AAC.1